MNKHKKYSILFWGFLCIFVIAVSFCVYYYAGKRENEQIYEKMAEDAKVTETPTPAETVEQTPEPMKEEKKVKIPEESIAADIPIDFTKLQQQNPDIYAWIQIPDTVVDYPIVQSAEDNVYYLNHTVEGAEGYPGSIYTENINQKNFTDKNTVIYGHNMDDGTMFGGLHQYVDPAYMNQHPEIHIYTPEHKYIYRVFAAVTYDNRHILETYNCNDAAQFQEFLDSVMSVQNIASHFSADETVTADDRIITLSTCNGNSEQRFLIEAVLSNEK